MTSRSEEGAGNEESAGDIPPGPAPSGPLAGEASRLHPGALGVWTIQSAFSLLIVLVVTGMLGPVGLGVLLALLAGIGIRYLRFRWRLEPDAVVIEEGFLVRKRRVIRRERIQTVDLERGISHRLLGVVEVRIEAIGGGGTEGKLAAVAPAQAEELRRVLLTAAASHDVVPEASTPSAAWDTAPIPESAEEEVLARVSTESLILAGVTGGRVGVAAALVGFFFQTVPETWWAETLGRLIRQAPDPTTLVGLRVLIVLVVFALLAGFLLSVVATVFTHWDFTLSAGKETLGVRRGLFTEHRDTVPFRRIQAVRVEENIVRRLLGRAALRVTVAGRAGSGSGEGTDLLLPIGRTEKVFELARHAVGLGGSGPFELHPMPRRARRRRMTRAVLGALAIGAAAGTVTSIAWEASPWHVAAWSALGVLGPFLLLAEGAYRGLGWVDLDTHQVVREGVLNRATTIVPTDRLQVLETTANPFQRVAGLATLQLRVARPLLGATPRALDLAGDRAGDQAELLSARVARRA